MEISTSLSSLLLAAAMALSGGSDATVHEPVIVEDGVFVCEGGIPAGWYSISPEGETLTKAAVFDCETFDSPVQIASYVWEEGVSFLSDDPSAPEQYVIPLWDGCFVVAGYYGGISYDKTSGEASWQKYNEEISPIGHVRLEYVAPLNEHVESVVNAPAQKAATPATVAATPTPNTVSDRLLYEDENLAISYSDFYVEKVKDSSYIKTELLITNKTERILTVSCSSVIINGCAVSISKYVDVPANTDYLHSWTNNAEMYLKYNIESVDTFSMVFSYRDADTFISGKSIQTKQIDVK